MKHAGDSVRRVQREIGAVRWQLNPKNMKRTLTEEDRKDAWRQVKELKITLRSMTDALEQGPDELTRTLDRISRGERRAEPGQERARRGELAPRRRRGRSSRTA
jgi:septal ring factor EnvC (AmiA/AmiB activator)